MKKYLKAKLKKISILKKIVRGFKLPPYNHKNYLKKKFKSIAKRNRNSADSKNFIVVGSFKSKKYYLRSSTDSYMDNFVHYNGVWERWIADFIYSQLNKGHKNGIIIDVGAHIGTSTIPQAVNFPQLNFICLEPHPSIFQKLKENIIINRLNNVEIINKAVSNSKSVNKVTFFASDSENFNTGLSSLNLNPDIGNHQKIEVENTRLDDVVSKIEKDVLLIKIDTQGGELDVIYSSYEIIKKNLPVVIFEYEEEYHSSPNQIRLKIIEFFRDLGYELFTIPEKNNLMYKLNLNNYYSGDIVALPINKNFKN